MRVENARTCVLSLESLLFSPDSCYGFFLGGGRGLVVCFWNPMQCNSIRFTYALSKRGLTRGRRLGAKSRERVFGRVDNLNII